MQLPREKLSYSCSPTIIRTIRRPSISLPSSVPIFCPSLKTVTRSEMAVISSMLWEMNIMPTPEARRSRMISSSLSRSSSPSAVVGSSKIRILG